MSAYTKRSGAEKRQAVERFRHLQQTDPEVTIGIYCRRIRVWPNVLKGWIKKYENDNG